MNIPAPPELLQNLIRFDTTNPPGNERACMEYINALLKQEGCETTILASDPDRPNLISRLNGQGKAPPLLLYGHVDVVTAEKQGWLQPPFEGRLLDGYIWGRGALDMKGGIVIMLTAFLRAKREGVQLPGDVILALLSDEEAGGYFGARYLVEEHPHQFQGVRYAVGEFGGFSLTLSGRRFYPIMVAEKQVCRLRATLRGNGGHASLRWRGGAMARLAGMLKRLDEKPLPVHLTPAARMMFQDISAQLPLLQGLIMRQMLNPLLARGVLGLLGEKGRRFEPLLRNTVNATVVRGGEKVNVIPSEITVDLDARLLPGFTPEELLAELRDVVGNEVGLEVVRYDPGPAAPDLGLFGVLRDILKGADPAGAPVPMLLPAATDGRLFARLGIQTYGFLPMPLPDEFNFSETIHSANERIPVAALEFGSEALFQLLARFGNE